MGLSKLLYDKSPHLLRTAFLNVYAYSLNFERYGRDFERLMDEFARNEQLSRGELEEYQREKLVALIHHAYEHVPYYHNVMKGLKLVPSDFKGLEDLPKLPVLTREDVKKHNQLLQADNVPKHRIRHGHTSGTTGSPLGFLWDLSVCTIHHVADWRQKGWAGLKLGDPFISVQGRQVVPATRQKPPFWVMNAVHNQLFMSSFHLKEEFLDSYVDKIRKFGPKGVEGYPSTLYILARHLKKRDRYCAVPAVLTSSETLLPIQRELIEERFQCPVFDFYGMAERVVYASECQYHRGKHLNMDYGIVEVVDNDNDTVSEGTLGTIVATGLWNHAMPLIRYRTSDVTAIHRGTCACGRNFPLMDQVTTKAEDIVLLEDGRMVPSSILTHPFKPMDNIVKSQIIQIDTRTLDIYLVTNRNYSDSDSQLLLKGMKERVGSGMNINLRIVDDIPNEKSGKFRWVISKLEKGSQSDFHEG